MLVVPTSISNVPLKGLDEEGLRASVADEYTSRQGRAPPLRRRLSILLEQL
jgi:hypothetical protein